jgi:hypothetical protein
MICPRHHIVARHPEIEPYHDLLLEVVRDPDFIARGLHDELKAVRLSIDLPMGARYIVVVYREITPKDGFIITARLGSGIANVIKGGVLWRKK